MKKGTWGIYGVYFLIICVLIIAMRGLYGVPTIHDLNNYRWIDDIQRARFALIYSVLEEQSVHFSVDVARFATPDLGYHAGKYVSLFAPGVSYLAMPGYLLGKYFGASQVGAYAIITFFAVLNTLLLYLIAVRLGAVRWAAVLGSLTFIFATPAFTYAVSLFQHHVTTFLFLASIYCLVRWKSDWRALAVVWFCVAMSVNVDYPNAVLFSPIIIYALYCTVAITVKNGRWSLLVNPLAFISPVAILLPLALFMWFNQASYGNPWQIASTVASVKAIDSEGKPAAPRDLDAVSAQSFTNPGDQDKAAVNFFQSRNLLNGFFVHFISSDRGIMLFTPVVLFGLFGVAYAYKNYPHINSVLLGGIGVNVLLYSMWSDPWGGWAFGSRYLVMSYALMSIFVALGLTVWRKNLPIVALFFVLFSYSAGVNTLGTLTSNANPPQAEVAALEKLSGIPQLYTYERNYDLIRSNKSQSFLWQTFLHKYISAWQLYQILVGVLIITCLGSIIFLRYDQR